MDHFRRLLTVVLIAGAAAGLSLAALQSIAVVPLIHAAEGYQVGIAGDTMHHHEWEPADGIERTTYTTIGTMLTGVGFSALLFGVVAWLGLPLDGWRGVWLGLAGFTCLALAPAIGLPPRPPGAAAAQLQDAQVWWVGTALATAVGLWAVARAPGGWTGRLAGLACLLAPHLAGAPPAVGSSTVPAELMRRFAVTSVATQGIFWILLGGLGGHLYTRVCGGSRWA